MITVSKKERRIFVSIVDSLFDQGVIAKDERDRLLSKISATPFNWKLFAKYSFWFSACSFIIAVSALLMEGWILQLLSSLVEAPDVVKMSFMATLASILYGWGYCRSKSKPFHSLSNELLLFLGVLATAGCVYYLEQVLANKNIHSPLIFLLSALLYGFVGFARGSKMVWSFALLSLGSWLGAETGYMSGWGAYWFGLRYPLHFFLFGSGLVAVAVSLKNKRFFCDFYPCTRNIGLLYLFTSLWILSIFGNNTDIDRWTELGPILLFLWKVLFALVSVISVYLGFLWKEKAFRSFGLTFLFINFYTCYFEYFWNTTHKAIFFALLGASLWYLGSHGEKIWLKSKSLFHQSTRRRP